ncbi:hypothetical protein ER13_02660 [Brevundimonas sp. EAKA]|jgi:hypothetical protein|uniref:DUF2459 domain-containing protein n=1 Tax=Brevundimonas sp. EAKA TaxID=1495854 RepID=UPI0004A89AAC|nr:DUF2459 domain-containing protein [Brevundimonas sp. EAKA]KDP93257.1 hypothetical protein ER13_02660 [Brevundimonas sp. EAKA]
MRWALPLAVLIGVVAALLTWTRPGASIPSITDAPVTVYLLDNGFHTDLAVPRAALERRGGPLGQAVADLAPGDWILIGWGDAAFYVDQSPISDRLPDGARAFFRPGNPSVVMLDPESLDPRDRHAADRRAALRLPPGAFDRMAGRIESSLDLADGGPRVATARAGDDARFFASRESFSILHLCNHWTAGALNAGGVAIRPARSAFSGEVMRSVRAAELDRAAPRA